MNDIDNFSIKIIKSLDEISKLTVQQLIEYINTNNRRRSRINQIDTTSVFKIVYEKYLYSIDFNSIPIGNDKILLSSIEKILQEFDNDLEKVEEIKEVIRTDVNPYMFEYSEDNLDYVPTNYEDLLFFSLDSNSILDVVEEKYFSQQVKQKSDDISIFSLNQFDKLLYDRIIQNPKLINSVTWREFEYLLSKILEEFEYEVELQKGTKDGGIDIIAIKNDHVVGKHKYLIQAKKWKNKVGVEPVQQLAFLREHHNATKACLVTTSSFTSGAWELAKLYPWQLELRDYDGLLDWIKLVGIKK